jgi:formate hydrogenlyase subunit 6/NADH:ubiquinone oxidoreductase subunit I
MCRVQEKENQQESRREDRSGEEKGGRHAWAYLLPEMWRAVTQHPITLGFPRTPLDLPPGFRGRVIISDADACRGCGLCARDCPADALKLERKGRDEFRLIYYPDRCAYCGQCDDSCVHDVIALINEFSAPTTDRDTLVEVLVERTPEDEEE